MKNKVILSACAAFFALCVFLSLGAVTTGPITTGTVTNVLSGVYIPTASGIGTNTTIYDNLTVTNADGILFELQVGAAGFGNLSFRRSGTQRYFFQYDGSLDEVNLQDATGDKILVVTGQNGSVQATNFSGNDIKTHERFQFANLATTTVNNTSAETTLTNATSSGVTGFAAGYLTQGTTIFIEAAGNYSAMETAETLTLRFKVGATTVADEVLTINAATGRWKYCIYLTIRTAGASASVVSDESILDAGGTFFNLGSSASTIDTTAALTFNITAQMNQTGDTMTCDTFFVKVLRP